MRRCPLSEPLELDQIELGDEARRYLVNVLRLGEGDRFIGFDGQGMERVFELCSGQQSGHRLAQGIGEVYRGKCGAPIGLCFALPKGDKLDLVARQITELGIAELHLWSASRSVGVWKREKVKTKLSRLQRVISEAARQSGRADQLAIEPPAPLTDLVERHRSVPLRLFFDPQAPGGWDMISPEVVSQGTHDEVRGVHSDLECVILVGPEGGLEESEIDKLKTAGWCGVRLSSPILRTETAGVVACALALDRLGYLA